MNPGLHSVATPTRVSLNEWGGGTLPNPEALSLLHKSLELFPNAPVSLQPQVWTRSVFAAILFSTLYVYDDLCFKCALCFQT